MTKHPKARIYRGTRRNLVFLAARLRAGELVAVPTETVYGLAANALDPAACARIFRAKGRPTTDPLIVHIHSFAQLIAIGEPNTAAMKLARRFWPGPLTLILQKKSAVPDIVTAGKNSVAVRMPSHPLFRRLLKLAKVPLAAPSANAFGYVSPTTAKHVRDGLGGRIAHILDGGASRIGLESTIVDVRKPKLPRLLRPGAITLDDLEQVLHGQVRRLRRSVSPATEEQAQIAPGLLARHYSPHTPVVVHQKISRASATKEAFVFLKKPAGDQPQNVFWLDARGDLRGAARRLFAVLRRIDAMKFKKIHVELAPGHGLASAINDRLRRAAGR